MATPGGGRPKRVQGMEARVVAADLIAGVMKGKLLDQLLDEGPSAAKYQALDPRDRGLARAIVGFTLRRNGQIEEAISRFLTRPLPDDAGSLKAIMAISAAQILFMDVADHAAVALGVELAALDRGAAAFKGLANAVLRRIADNKQAILAEQDPVTLNTPAWLMERWTAAYGAETARAIAEANAIEPTLDLTVKSDAEGWAARLGGIVLPTGTVRIAVTGAVEKLDGYEEGQWWVQDAAAALPVYLFGDLKGKKVADLCAAPGGKTALLAELGAEVTSLDISYHRLQRLERNLYRLGLKANIVKADATEWLGGTFDMVLLDAPCTATGTLRRHPDGMLGKKPADVAGLAAVQRKLIDQAIRMLRPGGLLVYSTCSLEPEEGPDQIRRLMLIDAPLDVVPVTAEDVFGLEEVITSEGYVRTLPCHLKNADPRLSGLDGFFAARLRKRV
ncbi:RsmB/NOP family class I SAM-dependent RNA methyltransferase [Oryzibacter oryziterrae]|uniref:RsmB/NOP family class I SAM-dependent RNA methyltransferase n=1 Tax=Oryzibacter oryziterrae TaxID=2766474 RepID=UPI001F1C9662|nr:RsmB/NOP family class I SAM-dependent RNA methyltransferase [Oryzibacter oryziterrae]